MTNLLINTKKTVKEKQSAYKSSLRFTLSHLIKYDIYDWFFDLFHFINSQHIFFFFNFLVLETINCSNDFYRYFLFIYNVFYMYVYWLRNQVFIYDSPCFIIIIIIFILINHLEINKILLQIVLYILCLNKNLADEVCIGNFSECNYNYDTL